MAEGFSEFQSSEESEEVPSAVASVDKGKSDEEQHVHFLLQEGSVATGGDAVTRIEQLQDTVEDLSSLSGEHEHGRLVHTVHSTSCDPVSDELLIPECNDELVGQEATSSHHACQKVLNAQQKKFQLELELGRRSFLEDKQKRNEKVYQSFRTHANEQSKSCSTSGASYDFTGMEGKPLSGAGCLQEPLENVFHLTVDGAFSMDENPVQEPTNSAFHMEKAPEHEPRSHSTNPNILDLTTEGSPPRNYNMEPLPENPPQLPSADNVQELHSSYKDRLAAVEGDPMTESRETETCMSEDQNGLLATAAEGESQEHINQLEEELQGCGPENPIPRDEIKTNSSNEGSQSPNGQKIDNCGSGSAACNNLQQQPTYKWMRFGARPKTRPGPVKRTPQEPSLVESLTCGLSDAVHVPVDSSESGITKEFLVRHSRDRSLLESLHHSNIENELTSDFSLPGASYMESMMNYIEADRINPHRGDDEVAYRSDEHNRLNLPLLMRQDERGYAVGGFNQSLNGTTGPDCTHVAAAGSCNGALNGVLSGAESTAAHPYAPGNASSTCTVNLFNPAGDQVAVVSEPCSAESANSRDFMSERSTVTDCNGINAARRIQEVSVASGERQIEGEQQREASVRAWNSNRFQGQAEDFIIESLDPTPNSARAQARREAVIRASREDIMRGPCSEPVELSCVCLETDGTQACCVRGTIVPETCQQDSAHDKCCKCLQDVFIGSKILPCSHPIHTECLVSMIQNDELICPLCGRAFVGSS